MILDKFVGSVDVEHALFLAVIHQLFRCQHYKGMLHLATILK